MKNAYEIIKANWYKNKPLKLEKFTLKELRDAMSQGCSDRNYSAYMHYIAKRIEQLEAKKK